MKAAGWIGAALVAVGAGFVYWQAGVIVAGLLIMRLAAATVAERRKAEEQAKAEAVAQERMARAGQRPQRPACGAKPAAPAA